MSKNTKCYIGLSGGVDSAVAAHILKQQGDDVSAVYANCFYTDAECRNSQDHADAVKVAAELGIEMVTKDYRKEYKENVLEYFYKEYSEGRTPNPDILCNSEIKFGVMAYDIFAKYPEAYLATGHYVGGRVLDADTFSSLISHSTGGQGALKRVISLLYKGNTQGLYFLLSGKDSTKDQSYFLYRLYDKTENIDKYVFPLAELSKAEVRKLAGDLGLNVATKPDSQGICFVGDVKIREFISKHVKSAPGAVVNTSGEVIGKHTGIQSYTIGQRHGFDISRYSGEPLYIADKILDKNVLVVGTRADASIDKFIISNVSFPYNIDKYIEEFNNLGLSVRIRNLGKKIPCRITQINGSKNSDKKFEVKLDHPEFGVAPGQSAVFYIDRLMLGGGVIEHK